MKPIPTSKRKQQRRAGTATVEFAFCAPLFFLLIFAGIEIARVNMLMHTVDSACVQAARRGIVPGATADAVRAVAESTMDIGRVEDYTVTVMPAVITPTTEEVSVRISVATDTNGYVMPRFFGSKTIERTLAFQRE